MSKILFMSSFSFPVWRCSACAGVMGGAYQEEDLDMEHRDLVLPDLSSAYGQLVCPYCGESESLSIIEIIPIEMDAFVCEKIGFDIRIESGEMYRFFLDDEVYTPHKEHGSYMLTLYRSGESICSVFLDTDIDGAVAEYGVDEEDQWILSFGGYQIFSISC